MCSCHAPLAVCNGTCHLDNLFVQQKVYTGISSINVVKCIKQRVRLLAANVSHSRLED